MVLALVAPVAVARAAATQDYSEAFEALRQSDLRMATIGERLAVGNAALCDRLGPGTGLQLHTLDQYDSGTRDAARAHFKFATAVAIEAIVPGTPADQAGLKPDDSLVRIGPVDIATGTGRPGTTDRLVATELAIADLPPTAPIEVDVLRGGAPVHATIHPLAACRSRFELVLSNAYDASADGTMVQVSSRILDSYPDDQAAAAIAHEFAHNILRHRERLEARHVSYGLLEGFGGNVKYFRQTELQADLLSVYLLENAGYPPEAAVAFWRRFGPSVAGGILLSRSHPAWRDRMATIEAEIARLKAGTTRADMPPMIAERDRPLDGDWQSLLVHHR
ncbi:MAG: M48 family metallopeptidase [Sphingomonas sp.]